MGEPRGRERKRDRYTERETQTQASLYTDGKREENN